jgi:hypothetical protein
MKYLISIDLDIPAKNIPESVPLSEYTDGLKLFATTMSKAFFEPNGTTVTDVRVTRMSGPVES